MDSRLFSKKIDEVALLLVNGFPVAAASRYKRLVASIPNVSPSVPESALKTAVFRQVGPKVDRLMTNFRICREADKKAA